MAIHYPTAPARAGERGRTPSPHLYAREAPVISPDELEAPDAWEAVQPVRPDTPHVRALRFVNATGELLAAVILVAGTIAGYGVLRPF
ncbi:hypothetical protein [Methylobacterium platani]|uniref:hypothetical protein n=1 Tax=Methylobacterium platani TaxID=427683 RepID=UPI0009E1A9BB|nr:hypothetical protein [Methylobacterium platani]